MPEFVLRNGVELQRLDASHVDPLYEIVIRERTRLARWMPWAQGSSRQDIDDFVRRTIEQHEAGQGMQTAIVADGRVAGTIGVHGISWPNASTSIGYWLSELYEGRGIMTSAVRAYTEHAFRGWKLNRMELRAAVENRRSRAVAERLGFVEEGVLRQAERVGNRYHDLVVYSALAREWR
ncbi:MAG TPA: GNAT family protein [Solirubrobacteraceae bacterium]|nr:GNAT family protein [Solirubrobacteraceae bacterium]